jgi:hypothetical protein
VELNTSISTFVSNLKSAIEHADACRKDHVALRIKYLEGLAEAIISKRCPILEEPRFVHLKAERISHEIRELKKRDHKRRMYKQIGSILHPETYNQGGLSRVDIPADGIGDPFPAGADPKTWSGDWNTITNPEDIAQHICATNSCHYHQAHDTPFASEPLSSYFGQAADSLGANHLLQGELPDDAILSLLQPETIQMLHTMSQPLPLSPLEVSIEITPDPFCSCYSTVKERTSSSPSGQHIGHYKAAAQCEP